MNLIEPVSVASATWLYPLGPVSSTMLSLILLGVNTLTSHGTYFIFNYYYSLVGQVPALSHFTQAVSSEISDGQVDTKKQF